ncbi:MAG: OB-fold domain-containing protein [Alphaproteobacteria bacterium]|nr:OB-fold domain-containing protein [Alphaproteobacteria bacterium]
MTAPMHPAMPKVQETLTNAPMLAAWRAEGALALQRCADCATVVFFPRSVCPHCWSTRLDWFRATGTGRIVSFSVIHRGLPEAFQADAPIVLAEVALAEGVPMIARVAAPDVGAVRSGMAVRLVPRDEAARYPLPTFAPA